MWRPGCSPHISGLQVPTDVEKCQGLSRDVHTFPLEYWRYLEFTWIPQGPDVGRIWSDIMLMYVLGKVLIIDFFILYFLLI